MNILNKALLMCVGLLSPIFHTHAQETISGLDKQNFNKYWTIESETPDYIVHHLGDTLEIVSPKGLTLWRKEKMEGELTIEYDACVMDEGLPGDRLSDLNCFWMASDPQHPNNLWKRMKWRNGIFLHCYSLQLYYLGYGGNHNSTTRFRRYDGNETAIKDANKRPVILQEYTDAEHLLKANKWYHIRISNKGDQITYSINGERIIDFRDANPLTVGWFGFRTTLSRTRIANFHYTQEQSAKDENITLQWIDATPPLATSNSLGIPFAQGSVKTDSRFALKTDDGQTLDYDFWPLAYWPDGSIKWGGFATVVPDSTSQLSLSIHSKGKQPRIKTNLQVTNENQRIIIHTGPLTAYLSKEGNHLFDSLIYKGTRVANAATLICQTEKRISTDNTKQISFEDYQSHITHASIERAGNVRTVIKLEGTHSNSNREWLPFIVRLYFYNDSEQIKIVHTLLYDGDQDTDFIRGLGIRFKVPLEDELYNRHIAFTNTNGGVWSEPVQPLVGRRPLMLKGVNMQPAQMQGKRIPSPEAFDSLGQSLIHHWAAWDGYRLSQLNADAFSIRKKATEDSPWIGTLSDRRANGFAFIGDTRAGLAVCLHDFWQSYPSTLEISSACSEQADLTVWLWSPEGEAMDLRHYDKVAHDLNASYEDVQEGMSTPYGIARTSTIMLRPYTYKGKAAIAQIATYMASEPQLICTPEYLQSHHAFGIWSLPDYSTPLRKKVEKRLEEYINFYHKSIEQHKWYGFWNYGDVMHAYDPVRHEWRYDIGGYAWDNTELASNMWLWYSFLRTGRSDVWYMAKAMGRHTAEVDVYHFGENAGLGTRHNVSHWGCGAKEARISQAAWNRFYYYLTTDERTGDLMAEVKDAEQKLYTLDPMRLAQPRALFPCTAPARLRIGPDWLAYAGNWMTQWERTGDIRYRDKIIAGMKSIAALPHGIFTGPKALGFDPSTGIISYEGDTAIQNTNHLLPIMGGFEIVNELIEMLPLPEWNKVWLEHAQLYKKKALEISNNHFRIPRLAAYAAYHLANPKLCEQAWEELLRKGYPNELPPFKTEIITQPEVLEPMIENPAINTNDAATWSLDAIYLLEVCPK